MTAKYFIKRFLTKKPFPRVVKTRGYSITLLVLAFLLLVYQLEWLSLAEWRMVFYFLYLLIFAHTYFYSFTAGLVSAMAGSIFVAAVLAPQRVNFKDFSFANLEVFPFMAKYFLIAITAGWVRNTAKHLQQQILANQQLQAELHHLEKLVMAGKIAAGIAHEIRNPLTVVQGYLQLISDRCKKLCNSAESFILLQDELKRANKILSDFLCFSRPDKPQKTKEKLSDLLESATTLLYGEALFKKVQILLYLSPGIPEILLDKNQIIQVFLNLLNNALQAIPTNGTISVYTAYDEKTELVTIRIYDTGIGMTPESMEQIFIPFYTTKADGTGLGLAITQAIILAHGGRIEVESSPGEGTVFTIILPANHYPKE